MMKLLLNFVLWTAAAAISCPGGRDGYQGFQTAAVAADNGNGVDNDGGDPPMTQPVGAVGGSGSSSEEENGTGEDDPSWSPSDDEVVEGNAFSHAADPVGIAAAQAAAFVASSNGALTASRGTTDTDVTPSGTGSEQHGGETNKPNQQIGDQVREIPDKGTLTFDMFWREVPTDPEGTPWASREEAMAAFLAYPDPVAELEAELPASDELTFDGAASSDAKASAEPS